jgi:uncharacterized damage-inducible protein DinB
MSQVVVNDLVDQIRRTFQILHEEIERFSDHQWVTGLDFFQTPVKVAMHIVDCLDYYFSGKTGDEYQWDYRFGGGWWELPDEKLPSKDAVQAYAREIEERIISQLQALDDADLFKPAEIKDGTAATTMGHLVYALRHTLHHHGELATLAVYHGLPGGSWA